MAGHTLVVAYTATSLAFTLLSFPNLMLPAAVLGAVRARAIAVRQLSLWALLAALAIHLLFVLRYGVIDQYTFLVPSYTIIAILAGIGFAYALSNWPRKLNRWIVAISIALPLLSPAIDVSAANTARHFHALGRFARNKPYRDDYRYLFVPWGRGEDSAARLSRQAIDLADGNGVVIVEDEMAEFAIEYQMYRDNRQSLTLTSSVPPPTLEQYAQSGRPVVLVPAGTNEQPPAPPVGHWKRTGDIYLLDAAH